MLGQPWALVWLWLGLWYCFDRIVRFFWPLSAAGYQYPAVQSKLVAEQFQCPCHGSLYDLAGNVVRGPAPLPKPYFNNKLHQAA